MTRTLLVFAFAALLGACSQAQLDNWNAAAHIVSSVERTAPAPMVLAPVYIPPSPVITCHRSGAYRVTCY